MTNSSPLDLIKRIKALSETGIIYHQNEYDKERYDELLAISIELMSNYSKLPAPALNGFFLPPSDYPTPKVDIRAFALNEDNKILLVKEKLDGKWALPGGWADIGYSPSEVITKEIKEETGLDSKVTELLAIYDKKCHPHPPQPFYVYKLVFLCEVVPGNIQTSFDIEAADYFAIDDLPLLSEDRILESQLRQLHGMVVKNNSRVYFD